MSVQPPQSADAALDALVESARRLGIELDETAAQQWLAAIGSWNPGEELAVDDDLGVYGHKIVMLDFSPSELAYFRELARLTAIEDERGVIETAIALSGSAAQSKIQTYPGDCDFFQRVNIYAPTRAEACRILARAMRDKAIRAARGRTYQLIEVKFGSYPVDLIISGKLVKAGAPIAWGADEIRAGEIRAFLPDDSPYALKWDDVAEQPGWCKLDWVVADPTRGRLANASNMLDVTWEAPDGSITPLDGYLDPYFQEVYLEADSIPIFTKLSKHVSSDALDDYVATLQREVRKYLTKDVNYGKAAKRMYNIFRLTGRYPEAAYIRELFDEPATMLYQVWSLIRTVDDWHEPGLSIPLESVLEQMDQLIVAVIKALEGDAEAEIVRLLLRLRDILVRQGSGESLTMEAEGARQRIINLVNNFFYERLTALPQIKEYIDEVSVSSA
jgi:hypothetical protein